MGIINRLKAGGTRSLKVTASISRWVFYRNYRQGIGLARNCGGVVYLSAGYRIGRGEFQPWYKERETDESGEFKIGWVQPLLQGPSHRSQRVHFVSNSDSAARGWTIGPLEVLQGSQDGNAAYWGWVTAGLQLKAQEELLILATTRVKQIEKLIAAGDEMSSIESSTIS